MEKKLLTWLFFMSQVLMTPGTVARESNMAACDRSLAGALGHNQNGVQGARSLAVGKRSAAIGFADCEPETGHMRDTCERCAKVTRSPMAYALCCENAGGGRDYCVRLLAYRLGGH
ncbi:hypothetical protein HDE_09427 [Halotydeus destructor]|nr:hypothetical protein HDE_09427 [Halotydeus destructor]